MVTCDYEVIDVAYGGEVNLASLITGCQKGIIVYTGDVFVWRDNPGKYYCAHCGKKVTLGGRQRTNGAD